MPRPLFFLGLVTLTAACGGSSADSGAPPSAIEPLSFPDDPTVRGVPVGVRDFSAGDVTFSIWYPAPADQADAATEVVDLDPFIPQSVVDVLGDIPLEGWDSGAVRDAPVRDAGAPYPVVVFSHGFGGMRYQSTDLTVHLASRGYVVVSADHPGRMFGDVLPCLFSPALEGCDLSGFTGDPAVADIATVLAWLEGEVGSTDLGPHVDLEVMGLIGHSAGGSSTTSVGELDDRFDVLVPMAGGGAVARDVPTVFIDGTCDGVVTTASTSASAAASTRATMVHVLGAGHLAFSDLCSLDLGGLAEDLLVGRDDINETLLPQLIALGTDGCPGYAPTVAREECADEWLPLETSAPLVRGLVTLALDEVLKDVAVGVTDLSDPAIEVEGGR